VSPRILVVDDEANLRRMLQALLEDAGHEVRAAASGAEALAAVPAFSPEAVLLDLVLGDGPDGLAVLEQLKAGDPDLVVIMMSGKATLADAVRATRLGAFQFLEKPLSPESVLTTTRAGLDLAAALVLRWSGGTTVSATMALAYAAGVRVFATGGVGGVHRGATGDVSTDLEELARTPVAVVCSGAKSILDLDRTLEWLETRGVPVAGWQTERFPEFFSPPTSRPVSVRVDGAAEAARLIDRQRSFGGGPLICVPCPADQAVPAESVAHALDAAEAEASAAGIAGKDLTPFLLERLAELTGGATLRANLALLHNNAAVAGEIAVALTREATKR